jgi:hypothetical protein
MKESGMSAAKVWRYIRWVGNYTTNEKACNEQDQGTAVSAPAASFEL